MDFSCKIIGQDHNNIHKGITQRGMNVLEVYLLHYWHARLTYEINHSLLLETLKKHKLRENIYYKAGGGRGRGVLHLPEKKRWLLVYFPHSITPLLWIKGFTLAKMSWFIVWCISLRGEQSLNPSCFIWSHRPFDTWYGSDSLAGSKYWDIQSKSIPLLLPAGVRSVLNSKWWFELAFKAFWGPIGIIQLPYHIRVGIYCMFLWLGTCLGHRFTMKEGLLKPYEGY